MVGVRSEVEEARPALADIEPFHPHSDGEGLTVRHTVGQLQP